MSINFLADNNGNLLCSNGILPIDLQDKTVVENGVVTADEGYLGLGSVTVDVPTCGGVSPSIRLGTSTEQAVSQKFFTDTLGGLYTVSGNTAIALSQVIGTDFNDIYINRSDLLPMFIELTDGGQQAFVITKTPSDYTFEIVAYNYLATDGAVCAVLKLLVVFDSEEVATLPLYVERTCDVIINRTTGATESVTAGWHTAVDANGKFSIGQTGIGIESLNGYTVNQLMTNQNNILSSTQFTVTINTVKSYVDDIVGDIETLLAGV